jgi:hypothetical protein
MRLTRCIKFSCSQNNPGTIQIYCSHTTLLSEIMPRILQIEVAHATEIVEDATLQAMRNHQNYDQIVHEATLIYPCKTYAHF